MLHPPVETANPSAVIAERPESLWHRPADSLKASALAMSSQAGEAERASPICAACWAY